MYWHIPLYGPRLIFGDYTIIFQLLFHRIVIDSSACKPQRCCVLDRTGQPKTIRFMAFFFVYLQMFQSYLLRFCSLYVLANSWWGKLWNLCAIEIPSVSDLGPLLFSPCWDFDLFISSVIILTRYFLAILLSRSFAVPLLDSISIALHLLFLPGFLHSC